MDCTFCQIIKNEIPSYKIFEDDKILIILDINPLTNGDSLVIPKTHYENILDIPLELLNHINKVSQTIYLLMKDKLNCKGLTMIVNNNYGQDIKHFHMHLTPRYQSDELNIISNKDLLKPLLDIKNILK